MQIPSPRIRGSSRKARIEIIPLIDIIFFLLATFMMVSLAMIRDQAIRVNLPHASTGTAQDRKDGAWITITESGDLYFNQEPLSFQDMPARLRAFKKEHPDPKIFINGDEKAYFGRAIGILDEVRKMGISKVAIETKQSPK
jgi:biopolymer transport protein ExbD